MVLDFSSSEEDEADTNFAEILTLLVEEGTENRRSNGKFPKPHEADEIKGWPQIDELISELWRQFNLGAPIAVLNFIWFTRFTVCAVFLGHLGGLELAGGTLALTYANVTGYSILVGLSGGLESLYSRAFGARRPDLMASALRRGIMVLLVASFPIGLIWLGNHRFLIFFGQTSSVATISSRYLVALLPDLILQAVLNPVRIFLRCQMKFRYLLIVSILGMFLHIGLCFLFVIGLNLGAGGTALATWMADLVVLGFLSSYVVNDMLNTAGNQTWGPLLKLAVLSCAMICLEWWCYEIIVLLSGLLEDHQNSVSVAAIVLNSDAFLYSLQIALASAACIRIGHELGTNSPGSAYHAAVISAATSFVLGFASLVSIVLVRGAWGRIFSSSSDVVRDVRRIMPVMGLVELFNSPLVVWSGVLRGSGRPATGVLANLGSFYAVGLPVSVVLGIVLGFGVIGLWIGLLGGVICCAALSGVAVFVLDWSECCELQQGKLDDEYLDDNGEELFELN